MSRGLFPLLWRAVRCLVPVVALAYPSHGFNAAVDTLSPVNSGSRLALVIGNSRYSQSPLKNPGNDANAIAGQLTRMGFTVTLKLDATKQEMTESIESFGNALMKQKGVGVFYFAGHGAQLSWRNYMIPVDAAINRVADMETQAVGLGVLLDYLRRAGNPMNVIILDACRDNPFGKDIRVEQKGLSQVDAPVGTLLAYATGPGSIAADGTGTNGLYTANLLKEIQVRESVLEDVFKRVRFNVRRQSDGRQIPWESTSLEDVFYFIPPAKVKKLSSEEAEKQFEEELARWVSIQGSKDPAPLEAFLRDQPSGKFSELAQFRLDRILAQQERQRAAALAEQQQAAALAEQQKAAALAEQQQAAALAEQQKAAALAEQQRAAALADQRRAAARAEQQKAAALAERQKAAALAEQQRAAALAEQQRAAALAEQQRAAALADQRRAEALAEQQKAAALAEQQKAAALADQQKASVLAEQQKAATLAERRKAEALAQAQTAAAAAKAAQVVPARPLPPIQVASIGANPFSKGTAKADGDFKVGDRYTYRVTDLFTKLELKQSHERITGLTDTEVIYNNGRMVTDFLGNYIIDDRRRRLTASQYFVPEYKIGKKWTTTFVLTRNPNRPNRGSTTEEDKVELEFKVVSKESVTIAAGTFDAFKVEGSGFVQGSGNRWEYVFWIAPDRVRRFLAMEFTNRGQRGRYVNSERYELLSFSEANPQVPSPLAGR